jgi:hypothetical protein
MLDEMHVNDVQLNASDVGQLENADEIAHFFAKLRYDVDQRTNIPDYAVLGMGSEDMRQHSPTNTINPHRDHLQAIVPSPWYGRNGTEW